MNRKSGQQSKTRDGVNEATASTRLATILSGAAYGCLWTRPCNTRGHVRPDGASDMSRGLGLIQRRMLCALSAGAALSLDELARRAFGERQVPRLKGRRRVVVTVPDGDLANARRALKGLLHRGLVERVISDKSRTSARHYRVSDRSTCNRPVFPGHPSESDGAPPKLFCCDTGNAGLEAQREAVERKARAR